MNMLWNNPYPPSSKKAKFEYPGHLMAWYSRLVRPDMFSCQDRATWACRRDSIIRQLRSSLGYERWPHQLELAVQVFGERHEQGFTIKRIAYQVWPGVSSTGYLYLPDRITEKRPAVLCPHGHWNQGAVDHVVQARCMGLALKGYVVLVVDAVHFAATLLGMTEPGIMTWNNIRAIDVLQSLAEVDETKIGCTGASGGAMQTQILMALEPRLGAAAPVCNVAFSKYIIYPSDESYCTCNFIPNLLQYSDFPELCAVFAPKPALYICATGDWTKPFPEDGFPQIQKIYEHYDQPEAALCRRFDCGHEYNQQMRELVYAFFNQHLRQIEDIDLAREPELKLIDPGLLRQLGGSPAHDLTFLHHKESAQKALEDYLQRFTYRREHITSKTSALKYAGDISQKMSDILNESGFTDSESISSKSGDDTAIHIDDCFLENLMLESEPDLWIPVTLFNPVDRKSHKAPSLIIAYPEGRWFFARTQEKLIRKITSRGIIVLLADIRFMGEMGGVDWRNNQQILGRYEIGMGARDLYAAARYLRARVDTAPDQIACLASGDAGLAAMAAAALGARFTSIILDDIGPTYAAGRNEPAPYNLLAVGDLPELFCAAGAADLYINTVDKEQFEFTRQYYAAIGLQEKLHLTATADYMARKEGIECFLASFGTHETAEDARAHTQDTLDLVLKNERSNRVYGPVTVAVPDYAGLPAFGMLKAEKPDCPALPYVRTEAGISLIADLPARQTVTYQISPGEIRTHRPANASKINTQVWPDGFCLNLEFGKVYIGLYIGCADDGDMFEKVKWLNMANIRKTTNCLFEKQVFHYFNNEWHILLTVISYTGGFVDVHASLSFRGADRPDKLHLAYLYIPANGTWEVKIKTDQENAIIIEPQNGHLHHADWLFCADTVQKRYILGSDVTQSGLPVQNKPFAIIRSDDKLLLLKQWSISNKQGKEQPVSQTMRFYRADEVTEDADLPHFYVYRSLLSDDQLQVVFSA